MTSKCRWQRVISKHTGYRDTTRWLGATNTVENYDVTRICSWKIMIFFLRHIPILLGWLFCIAAGKRYCLLQTQLLRNLFTTNKNKNFFFSVVKRVFTKPSIFRSIFLTVYACFVQMLLWLLYCCDSRASIDPFLWAQGSVSVLNPEMVQSLMFLLGYNIPRVTIPHTQHSLGTTYTDYNLYALRQNIL